MSVPTTSGLREAGRRAGQLAASKLPINYPTSDEISHEIDVASLDVYHVCRAVDHIPQRRRAETHVGTEGWL